MTDHDTAPSLGFIGLGHMGAPMARNLQRAGHDLVVHDVARDAGRDHEAAGASWAATPRAVGAAGDVVITMLPTPAIVERVLLGHDGLLEGMRPGGVWVDMSTSVPSVADRVRLAAAPRDIAVLDAPVAGMAKGAKDATLQIYVGGEAETYHRVWPILAAMGDPSRILHVGVHGSGYTVKLMVNMLWFAHLTATAEVLMTGVRAGVQLDVLRDALISSPANSTFLERDVLSVLDHGDYDESFALALACKDLGLAIDLGRDVGVPMEVSALVEQIYRRARAQYGDAGGEMMPVRLLEDAVGTELRRRPSS